MKGRSIFGLLVLAVLGFIISGFISNAIFSSQYREGPSNFAINEAVSVGTYYFYAKERYSPEEFSNKLPFINRAETLPMAYKELYAMSFFIAFLVLALIFAWLKPQGLESERPLRFKAVFGFLILLTGAEMLASDFVGLPALVFSLLMILAWYSLEKNPRPGFVAFFLTQFAMTGAVLLYSSIFQIEGAFWYSILKGFLLTVFFLEAVQARGFILAFSPAARKKHPEDTPHPIPASLGILSLALLWGVFGLIFYGIFR